MKGLLLTLLVFALAESAAPAQTLPAQAPKNPKGIAFICDDHDKDDGHEIDVIEVASGRVVKTLDVGDPPQGADGYVTVKLDVREFDFKKYQFVVRAKVGALKSDDSDPWEWDRAPANPRNIRGR